ncbi:MAG: hypothetical protein ABIQ75_01380 [Flavobacteriales bacterium]
MAIRNIFLSIAAAVALSPQMQAQNMLAYPVSTHLDEGSLTVMLHVFFGFGFLNSCPELSWDAAIEQDTVHLRAFYDISGVWPQAGCDRYDTVVISSLDESQCNLSMTYFAIDGGPGGSDTIAVDASEVVSFCTTGLREQKNAIWSVYPTSFTDHIELNTGSPSNIEARIQLFNAQGQIAVQMQRSISKSERIQLPTGLSNGPYWLVIEEKGGRTSIPLQRVP